MQQRLIFDAETPITVVRYQAANALLLCASQDGSIYGLDKTDNFRPVMHLTTGLQTIDGLDVHPREKVIALAGQGTHQFWDLSARRLLFSEAAPLHGSGSCLRFHHSGWAIFGSYGMDFVARDYKTGERRDLFIGADCNVCVDFHPAGRLALASPLLPQNSARIVFFEFLASGECTLYEEPGIEFVDDEVEMDIAINAIFAPRGDQLLSSTTNMYIMQSRAKVEEVGALLGFAMSHSFPECESLHEVPIFGTFEDLTAYAGAGENGETLYGPGSWLSNLVAVAGGDYGVCGTQAGDIVLINYQEGKVAHQTGLHQGQVNCVAALSNNQVVTGGDDGCLNLCSFSEEVGSLAGPSLQGGALASEQAFYRVASSEAGTSG